MGGLVFLGSLYNATGTNTIHIHSFHSHKGHSNQEEAYSDIFLDLVVHQYILYTHNSISPSLTQTGTHTASQTVKPDRDS